MTSKRIRALPSPEQLVAEKKQRLAGLNDLVLDAMGQTFIMPLVRIITQYNEPFESVVSDIQTRQDQSGMSGRVCRFSLENGEWFAYSKLRWIGIRMDPYNTDCVLYAYRNGGIVLLNRIKIKSDSQFVNLISEIDQTRALSGWFEIYNMVVSIACDAIFVIHKTYSDIPEFQDRAEITQFSLTGNTCEVVISSGYVPYTSDQDERWRWAIDPRGNQRLFCVGVHELMSVSFDVKSGIFNEPQRVAYYNDSIPDGIVEPIHGTDFFLIVWVAGVCYINCVTGDKQSIPNNRRMPELSSSEKLLSIDSVNRTACVVYSSESVFKITLPPFLFPLPICCDRDK